MTGEELKLTPYDDHVDLVPTKIYEVPIPKYVAVLHEQQLKDAYKRQGWEGVESYTNSVMRKAGLLKQRPIDVPVPEIDIFCP